MIDPRVYRDNEWKTMGIAILVISFLFAGLNPVKFLYFLVPVAVVFGGK